MNQVTKLHTLFMLCKTGVFIEYNEHKQFNDNLEDFLIGQDERKFIEDQVWDKMIELDTIIGIEFFPNALMQSHSVYHYDLDQALDKCLEIIDNLKANAFELSA